jgi:hypothetical protein
MDPRSFWEGQIFLARGEDINVRLNESKVALNNGANVLYPFDRTFLMGGDGTGSESTGLLVHRQPLGI